MATSKWEARPERVGFAFDGRCFRAAVSNPTQRRSARPQMCLTSDTHERGRCLTDKNGSRNSGWLLLSRTHACPIADKLINRSAMPAFHAANNAQTRVVPKFLPRCNSSAIRYRASLPWCANMRIHIVQIAQTHSAPTRVRHAERRTVRTPCSPSAIGRVTQAHRGAARAASAGPWRRNVFFDFAGRLTYQ